MRHLVDLSVPLSEAYEHLLTQLRITRPNDSQNFTLLLLRIARYLEEHPKDTCAVYRMSRGAPRNRSVNDNDEVENPFEGRNPTRPDVYPGDKEIRAKRGLTIQIHNLHLRRGKELLADNVPTIAVWIPPEMSADFVVQPQG